MCENPQGLWCFRLRLFPIFPSLFWGEFDFKAEELGNLENFGIFNALASEFVV